MDIIGLRPSIATAPRGSCTPMTAVCTATVSTTTFTSGVFWLFDIIKNSEVTNFGVFVVLLGRGGIVLIV